MKSRADMIIKIAQPALPAMSRAILKLRAMGEHDLADALTRTKEVWGAAAGLAAGKAKQADQAAEESGAA